MLCILPNCERTRSSDDALPVGVTGGFTELRKEPISVANGEGVEEVAGALEPYPTFFTTGGFTELKKELIMFAISERMGDVAGALEPYTPGGDGPATIGPVFPPAPMTELVTAFLILLLIDPLVSRAEVMAFPMLLPTVPGEVPGASLGGHNPGGHIPGGHMPLLGRGRATTGRGTGG